MDRTTDFSDRLDKCTNPLSKKLFSIMIEKKTNLCIAADMMSFEDILKLINKVGHHICILKLHSEHLGPMESHHENMKSLCDYKKKFNFLLFEDRKFLDGETTVRVSYEKMFAKYVDIVTVMPDINDPIFKAIRQGAETHAPHDEPRGCLAVCELSFKNVIRPDPQTLLDVAERNSDICIGIIGQKLQVSDRNNMIKMSPGVNLDCSSHGDNQNWRAPEEVAKNGADVLIVGRGITLASEDQWEPLAIRYKELCFGKAG